MSQIAQYQGTGKRKTSVARVILRPGDGKTWFNGRTLEDYFPRMTHRMAALAPLVGEMLGVERVAIEVQDDGVRHSVRIGDVIDFEIEDIVPFGIETGEPVRFAGMFHPVASDLTIAEATRSRINAFGIEYEGKTGLSTSEFSWAA